MDERSGLNPTSSASASRTSSEQYLGLLYTLEDVAIYGFQTCTRLRLLFMLSLTDHAVRDIDMLTLFRAVYTSYLKYSANPFHALPPTHFSRGEQDEETAEEQAARAQHELEQRQAANLPVNCRPIKSTAFDARIDRIIFASARNAAASTTGAPATGTAVAAAGR